ncbi:MAG: serine/threonine-protein kinase [Planctomycetaceae bacterium]
MTFIPSKPAEAGRHPTADPMLAFPLSEDQESLLATIVDDMAEGRGYGSLDEAVARHPDLADAIKDVYGAMLVADAVAERSAVFHDEDLTVTPPADRFPGARSFNSSGFVPGGTSLPARFGDYDLLEELGRGGMGIVYRAVQRSLGRAVALKMLIRGAVATSADLARFRSEVEAAARLDHPGIVPILEVGEEEGHPYFTMRLVEGTTLARRLAEGPLSARESAATLAKVADAVHAAHKGGILHRDLKPSNILIEAGGEPHVSDFGLAKRLQSDDSVTHTGAILGTPCYMSPEQAAGSRGEIGPSSDVWSLGAILYQTLTGRPPFQASSPVDTLLAVLENDPPVPRSLAPGIDRDLEMCALKSLQKPQDLRYASAADLANDLRAFLAGEPVAARSGGLWDVASRLFRETHHAVVLENWGLLWMWHSVVVLGLSVVTDILAWRNVDSRWPYLVLWGGGLAIWAPIFWALRHRAGPVTAVERQIAHVWGGTVVASVMLFWVEDLLALNVLTLSPVLALLAGLVFFVKAGILSGAFYVQAALLFVTALVMCRLPAWQHIVFGLVSGACFFVPGYKYYRQRSHGL